METLFPGGFMGLFEGVSSSIDSLCDKIKFFVGSWVSILPSFHAVPMDFILHKWKEVAFS